MKFAINYADDNFKKHQKYNTWTALSIGNFDAVIQYGPECLNDDFKSRNDHILRHKRGAGYWLWKPYIIKDALNRIDEDDYLFYCDSGMFYIQSIDLLIQEMEKNHDQIMIFEINQKEMLWSKRDALILMNCDIEKYYNSCQILGGCLLIKNTFKNRCFIDEWLFYAQDERILTDIPNQLGKDNYKDFKCHRHDQTILSLLSKKYELKPYRFPAVSPGYINDVAVSRQYESHYPRVLIESWQIEPNVLQQVLNQF